MSQYNSGTVTVTNGDATVTGVGTAFLANVAAGDIFTIVGSGVTYTIGSITNDTSLELTGNYTGTTASGQSYVIHTSFTSPDDIAYPEKNDIETATIVKRGINKIQDVFTAIRSGTSALTNALITGGTINGAVIGGATPAAGTFTTSKATTGAAVGGATPGAGGIAFPATAVAVADPNTLDDYEEGAFTPTVNFSGAAIGLTYASQIGKYLKIGNTVHFWISVTLSAKGTSPGQATIEGLPFADASGGDAPLIGNGGMAGMPAFAYGALSATTLYLRSQSASGFTALTDANFTNTSAIRIAGSYKI